MLRGVERNETNDALFTFLIHCCVLIGMWRCEKYSRLNLYCRHWYGLRSRKNEYIVYLQGLNFANVAKQEGARPTEKVPIFVGRAEGETLNLAISELYNKTENDLFLGHVSALVLSDKIVTHKFNEVIEEINRNRSLSSTLQIVTTEEEIEDVLNVEALFNFPPIYTILFKNLPMKLQEMNLSQ